jgi:hypothetical protein
MPGPIGKRDEERRRRNKPTTETITVNLDEVLKGTVEIPAPDEDWHRIAREWYLSLSKSGQCIFYEPSDWMTAYLLADVLDRWLKPQDVKVGQQGSERDASGGGNVEYIFEQKIIAMPGATLNALLKGMSSLMTTEGERRRLKIQLDRKAAQDALLGGEAQVLSIVKNREDLFKAEEPS